ncbi:DUF397 domain-containing protein [Streptomyces sp. or20]|uniref:DUF397 domain-containing protein n=1 Tax=Streptomyces sp. or20 TaxID=1828016 RepID=UPI000BF178A6|nr:DUF397 domain-containing protein [Streptomyces sp. or20]
MKIENGMKATVVPGAQWVKAKSSNGDGNCVELAKLDQGVAMRNSRFPDGEMLLYTSEEVRHFVGAVKEGEFDHLIA